MDTKKKRCLQPQRGNGKNSSQKRRSLRVHIPVSPAPRGASARRPPRRSEPARKRLTRAAPPPCTPPAIPGTAGGPGPSCAARPGLCLPPRPRAAGAGDPPSAAGGLGVARDPRQCGCRGAVRRLVLLKEDRVDCAPGRWSRAPRLGTDGRGGGWGQRGGRQLCVAAPSSRPPCSPAPPPSAFLRCLWVRGGRLLCSRPLGLTWSTFQAI